MNEAMHKVRAAYYSGKGLLERKMWIRISRSALECDVRDIHYHVHHLDAYLETVILLLVYDTCKSKSSGMNYGKHSIA